MTPCCRDVARGADRRLPGVSPRANASRPRRSRARPSSPSRPRRRRSATSSASCTRRASSRRRRAPSSSSSPPRRRASSRCRAPPATRVRPGDVLVRFEIPGSAADVQRQEAETGRARAALEQARAAHQRAARAVRARRRRAQGSRGEPTVPSRTPRPRSRRPKRRSPRRARWPAARSVRATFAGVVATRQHNPGDLVEPSATDPVLRVIDPHRLEVVASVPLADVSRVRVGAAARLAGNGAGSGDAVDGPALQVVSRRRSSSPARRRCRFASGPPARSRRRSGTPVQVDIDAEHHTSVVLVPAAAIVREGEETAVFVAVGGKAQRRRSASGSPTATASRSCRASRPASWSSSTARPACPTARSRGDAK